MIELSIYSDCLDFVYGTDEDEIKLSISKPENERDNQVLEIEIVNQYGTCYFALDFKNVLVLKEFVNKFIEQNNPF